MAITTRTQKGSALTIDEMDLNFLSTWEIITGLATNATQVSYNAGPKIEVAYMYATRFNVMAFQIVGTCTSSVLWYPNWILSRQNTTSLNAPSVSFVNPGACRVLGQSQSLFTSTNTNGTGWPAQGNNSNTYAPLVGRQVMLRGYGGHRSYEPWFNDMTYMTGNAGPQRYGGAARINNQNSYGSYRKAGIGLRTGNNANNIYFKGSLYLMGLRNGYGYNQSYWYRDNVGI